MLKALADRLAEAFAERLHQRVRTDLWGYAPDEALDNDPADRRAVPRHPPRAGLPGLPRPQRQARDVRRVLQAADIGMGLTESLAMTPAASVSGFYLAHPEATYFNVGRIGNDQVQDLGSQRANP
jgi:5-methyltetrahydrofolate--homocysteine methyltransferase